MSLEEAARQTLALLEAGRYTTASGATVDIVEPQARAVAGTRLYTPQTLATWREPAEETGLLGARVDVTDETTQQACQRLAGERVVALNFASARNPGGGFLNGAKAQEEDLCRCSGLYPTLLPQRGYYDANRATPSLLYTDHAIYSPRVPFFRVRGRDEPIAEPFLVSVITAPAPNTRPLLAKDPEAGPAIVETFLRRWRIVLGIAAEQGHAAIVLGAWGCGAFGGDPRVAATTARRALGDPRLAGRFRRIVFAIPGRGRQSARNLEVFRQTLSA
ncbi:MAG: TIGR02452 family protein [Polyangiaceae bacterium]